MCTFDDFFDVLTLKQLNRHSKPIIIYNVKGYYNSMLAMLDNAVSEKFMTNACNRLYTIADTEEEVFNQLENYVPFTYNKYEFLKKDGEQNGCQMRNLCKLSERRSIWRLLQHQP